MAHSSEKDPSQYQEGNGTIKATMNTWLQLVRKEFDDAQQGWSHYMITKYKKKKMLESLKAPSECVPLNILSTLGIYWATKPPSSTNMYI